MFVLACLGLVRRRSRPLAVAAILACLVVGETFPLTYRFYHDLGIGFWVGIGGGVLAVVGLAIAASVTRFDATAASSPVDALEARASVRR
jgi:hypothetical protein